MKTKMMKSKESVCSFNNYPKSDDLAVNSTIRAASPDFIFTPIHFSAVTQIFIPVSRANKEK